MNNAPAFLSTFSLSASVIITTVEASIVYKASKIERSGELTNTTVGKNNCPIEIETVASTMQLPIMSPIASSYCL